MDIVINFLEYGVRGIWYLLWFLTFAILAFACLGVIGNKQAKIKQAEALEKRKKLAEEEQAKAKAQMEKNAQFGGIDTTLDPTLQKKEEPKKEEVQTTAVDNTTPIVEQPQEEEKKEEAPSVLVINEDGSSG